ncbi:MAG: fructose-6-phosphate aldolase [Alphaproteobacteria bacterium]
MKLFADTADTAEIRALASAGLVDGVTTNPSLVAKAGRPLMDALTEICSVVEGPVSAEVTATDSDGMVEEGRRLREAGSNIVVKVPMTRDGLIACRQLTQAGASVNVTLCFSAVQALLAAKAGAAFVSPFIGRLDDLGVEGMAVIRDIRLIFDQYPDIDAEILTASVRSPLHVADAAKAGTDAATVPPAVIWRLIDHPMTDRGLEAFLKDWQSTGQSIMRGEGPA